MSASEKDKAYKDVIAEINKKHGDGSVMELGNRVGKAVPCIPTGIYGLDYKVLGIGGLPRGRITEIYGPESGGKTTTALTVIASAQRTGGRAAIVDAEHALDPNWANTIGVDVDKMLVSQPDHGEQALEITHSLIKSGAFDVIVVDSVAALVPKSELDGEIGDSHMGLQARMMGQTMRKFTADIHTSGAVVIFINQIREKIGVMFGSPETTTGGRALKFYASIRLDVRRKAGVKLGDVATGNLVKFKAAKNKMAPPFREAEVELLFDRGFDTVGSLLDAAVESKVVEKSGSWFSYAGERLGQGRIQAVDVITTGKLYDKILKQVREKATEVIAV